jgi:hypothetical protein
MDVLSGLGPMPSSIQQRAGGTRDTGSILFDDDKNISRKKQRHTWPTRCRQTATNFSNSAYHR